MGTRVHYTDDHGNPVAGPEHATAMEVVEELNDGTPTSRTYLERPAGTGGPTPRLQPGNVGDPGQTPDEMVGRELLTKRTWDIWLNENGQYRLAETLDETLRALQGDLSGWSKREFVGNLVTLPSFESAPERVRTEAFAYLDSTRTTPLAGQAAVDTAGADVAAAAPAGDSTGQ